jgi:hypothetical protein
MLKMSYISDVAYIADLVAEVLEKFDEYIICNAWPCMTEVCITVHCRAADIKSYVSFVDRFKELFLSRK